MDKKSKPTPKKPAPTKKPAAAKEGKAGELSDDQLKGVSGGARISKSDLIKLQ